MIEKILINKDSIKKEDIEIASKLIRELRSGKRVFGNPGEGLKRTLRKLEDDLLNQDKADPLIWKTKDRNILKEISRVKHGIKGEIRLSSYIEQIIKNDPELHGMIFFASLSSVDETKAEELGYIPDTDFVAVCGKNLMILDAKNISVSYPVYIDEKDCLLTPNGKLMQLTTSKYVWEDILEKEKIKCNIDGCTVIVSSDKILIFKNDNWYRSSCRPIFVGDLRDYLIDWMSKIEDKTVSLQLLTIISKVQIRKDKSNIDFNNSLSRFMK